MKRIFSISVLLVLLSTGFIWGAGNKEMDDVYVFATDATWAPMEFVDEEGNIVGFDMDFLEAVAKAAGFKYKVQNTGWDGIFAGLANGAYDAVISSVTINDERKKTMDFSNPYVNAGQMLVVPESYSEGETLADFSGKKVGAQQGTTGDFALEEYPSISRRAYDEIGLAIEDLINGNLDAVVCDSITAIDYVSSNENFKGKIKVIGEPFTDEQYGIAIQKGNEEFLNLLNSGIAKVFKNGTQATLVKKWLR